MLPNGLWQAFRAAELSEGPSPQPLVRFLNQSILLTRKVQTCRGLDVEDIQQPLQV